ncbi:MAG: type II toxin-antitoxin system VapC family toxin [Holosporales bacterium]|jgi:predicted nucleic acid-binding protein
MLVVDASAVLGFVFNDDDSAYAEMLKTYMRHNPVVAPDFFRIEANNVIRKQERRGRYAGEVAELFIHEMMSLNILYRRITRSWFSEDALYNLQREYDLTAYDALYLMLALYLKMPLATLDVKLKAAAIKTNLFWPGTP